MGELLQTAIEASIKGGKEILKIYSTEFEVVSKDDDSPLTMADKNANDVINTFLEPTGIPIISEENKQADYNVRKEWDTCWIVDPLDGTKEFIKRNGEFTVNIALVKNGSPVLGVIYVPVSKNLYFTDANGSKAYKIEIESEDQFDVAEILKKASIISPSTKPNKIRVVGSRSHLNVATQDFIDQLPEGSEVEIVSKGSSLKFCLVAEGAADVYPRFAPTMEWDTAAGHAICQAAGVKVIDQNTQKPMQYNKENLLNAYFLVTK
ncbi:3'(2'),5'-bisphosphate nucleotidase CysQ [Patiriisocius marinus]|uniref:3'(2'),5'-bisphosphate nucleotidase CysQ n=1 Tax=Patiriisocius marinus TaxID=1397112 RepID=UPI00232C7DEE|nr:3'(2'),5'-bisphosphate nucleotidase CysQ [Patiriisocius marinus]